MTYIIKEIRNENNDNKILGGSHDRKKSNRGGKREGAGRPAKENRTVTIAFCCYPEERDRLKEAVKASGKTQSAYILDKLFK